MRWKRSTENKSKRNQWKVEEGVHEYEGYFEFSLGNSSIVEDEVEQNMSGNKV